MRCLFALAALIASSVAAPNASAYDGCLGAKVTMCIDSMRPYLRDKDYSAAVASIDKYLAGDITGKRKPRGVMMLSYDSKFSDQFEPAQIVVLDYTPKLEISEIRITLHRGAGVAETEDEYQATHMYETTLFALGSRDSCRELASAHGFYTFFHTNVRTRIKQQKLERQKGVFNAPEASLFETGWIGLCGRQLNYISSSAAWGSVGAQMDRKYSVSTASLAFR